MTSRSASIIRGTQDPLLSALGVSYVEIAIEGHSPHEALCLVDARRVLKDAKDHDLIDADTAARLEREMTEFNVLPDMKTACEQARLITRPEGCPELLRFELCTDREELDTVLPRGKIVSSTGREIVDNITTLTHGLGSCRAIANLGTSQFFDIATVLLEMVEANLPADEVDRKARWNALDLTIRKRIEKAMQRIALQEFCALPFAQMFGFSDIINEFEHREPVDDDPATVASPSD